MESQIYIVDVGCYAVVVFVVVLVCSLFTSKQKLKEINKKKINTLHNRVLKSKKASKLFWWFVIKKQWAFFYFAR